MQHHGGGERQNTSPSAKSNTPLAEMVITVRRLVMENITEVNVMGYLVPQERLFLPLRRISYKALL